MVLRALRLALQWPPQLHAVRAAAIVQVFKYRAYVERTLGIGEGPADGGWNFNRQLGDSREVVSHANATATVGHHSLPSTVLTSVAI